MHQNPDVTGDVKNRDQRDAPFCSRNRLLQDAYAERITNTISRLAHTVP